MGALTLKSFPFELRGWDIEKFESIDPTDGFGSDTRLYIKNHQIIQIEPDYNSYSFNSWLTDKGRQFFDGIFSNSYDKNNNIDNLSWLKTLDYIQQNIYFFDHCNTQSKKINYFVIVFENLSLEVISLLNVISQNYSFIKIKRAQNHKLVNDFEASFQLNSSIERENILASNLCLLVNNNPRYEGFQLNLTLRQRFLKGNFKCFNLGSNLNTTFPISFLGSTVTTLKTIAEGNHLICQDFKSSVNPIIIFNSDIYQRDDGKKLIEMFQKVKNTNIFAKKWNGINVLNSSLSETGIYSTAHILPIKANDFIDFSGICFINTSIDSFSNLRKVIQLKTLNSLLNKTFSIDKTRICLDQNFYKQMNSSVNKALSTKYLYIPTSMFYENNETYINTEGFIKRTTKLVFDNNSAKSNWQILRKLLKSFKQNFISVNTNDNDIVYFNANKLLLFKNFINFQFYATQHLSNTSYYFQIKNKPFNLNKSNSTYKLKPMKIRDTKLKYWLDDFFIGGKDEYSSNSAILTNCSRILRTESTNFF